MRLVIAALRQSIGRWGALVAWPGSCVSETRTPQGRTAKNTNHQIII